MQRRSDDPRPTGRSSSIWTLRLRLPRHRPPNLRRWHYSCLDYLLLRCRYISVPARHVRDAQPARVRQSRKLVHGPRHSRVPLLQSRRVQVVRQMGCLTLPW